MFNFLARKKHLKFLIIISFLFLKMSKNANANNFLNISNLSSAVKKIEYAVRGRIVIRAGEIEKELNQVFIN